MVASKQPDGACFGSPAHPGGAGIIALTSEEDEAWSCHPNQSSLGGEPVFNSDLPNPEPKLSPSFQKGRKQAGIQLRLSKSINFVEKKGRETNLH